MTNTPQLTEDAIRRWTGEASFGRGQGYHRQGHIFNPRCQGDTLKARCLGSQPQPYHVEATLGPTGIVAGHCSCPVGHGGHCKHAAALLLTWLHTPEAFLEVEELETTLRRRTKDELVALICRMVDRYPDLETMLELAIMGGEQGQPVDAELIQRQVRNAFRGIGYDDWGAVYGLGQDLLVLVDMGDEYALRQDWRDAAVVYQTVAREVLENYGMVDDEGGELHEVVGRCVVGLGDCLAATTDPVQRETILRALFDVYRWDIDFGGIDMGYEAPDIIVEQATPAERQQVADWVQAALPTGDDWGIEFRRQAYGHFLLNLERDTLDDEAFLRICRETGRRHDLVDRLLALDRVDEAVREAQKAGDYDLLRLADVFVAHGHDDLAERLMHERAATSTDSRLKQWLKTRAEDRGDLDAALALAEDLFWQRPAPQGYQEVQSLARPLNRWPQLRSAILTRLTNEENYILLTEIHLLDDEIDRALETVERTKTTQWGWTWGAPAALRIKVAGAAEEHRPRDAIRLYLEQVERLIAARGRGNYASAAAHLIQVRKLYHHLDEPAVWQRLIADLRERHRRLPALQDELNQAGL